MSNEPIIGWINKHLDNGQFNILDVCCGNGVVSAHLFYNEISGLDIYEPYLEQYKRIVPNSKAKIYDVAQVLLKDISSSSYDVVVCIDGVEHFEYDNAVILIKNMERIAKNKIIIFTPEAADDPSRITVNKPHNAWDIKGGDEFQIHKCAMTRTFFVERGYDCEQLSKGTNAYDGTPYFEMLYVKTI